MLAVVVPPDEPSVVLEVAVLVLPPPTGVTQVAPKPLMPNFIGPVSASCAPTSGPVPV